MVVGLKGMTLVGVAPAAVAGKGCDIGAIYPPYSKIKGGGDMCFYRCDSDDDGGGGTGG